MDILFLLLSIIMFTFVTFAFAFAIDAGIGIAFQSDPNLYGVWILVVAAAAFSLMFIRSEQE